MSIRESIARYGYAEISSGTLRSQDLIPAMLGALRELAPAAYEQVVSPGCGFSAFPSYAQEDDASDWWDGDDCAALLESLDDALNEHAPDGYHYGSNEGDGASIGFWPNEPECPGHDSTGEPTGSAAGQGYPRTVYCDGSCARR